MQITAQVEVESWTDSEAETPAVSAAAEGRRRASTAERGRHRAITDDPGPAVASPRIIRGYLFIF